MNLRCYCCGDPICDDLALVTQGSGPVDRVFVMLPEHAKRVDGGTIEEVLRAPGPHRVRGAKK